MRFYVSLMWKNCSEVFILCYVFPRCCLWCGVAVCHTFTGRLLRNYAREWIALFVLNGHDGSAATFWKNFVNTKIHATEICDFIKEEDNVDIGIVCKHFAFYVTFKLSVSHWCYLLRYTSSCAIPEGSSHTCLRAQPPRTTNCPLEPSASVPEHHPPARTELGSVACPGWRWCDALSQNSPSYLLMMRARQHHPGAHVRDWLFFPITSEWVYCWCGLVKLYLYLTSNFTSFLEQVTLVTKALNLTLPHKI